VIWYLGTGFWLGSWDPLGGLRGRWGTVGNHGEQRMLGNKGAQWVEIWFGVGIGVWVGFWV
jgi:hypothetical protein